MSPTTALYLQDTANRTLIRERFPKADLPDARIDAVLQPTKIQFTALPFVSAYVSPMELDRQQARRRQQILQQARAS